MAAGTADSRLLHDAVDTRWCRFRGPWPASVEVRSIVLDISDFKIARGPATAPSPSLIGRSMLALHTGPQKVAPRPRKGGREELRETWGADRSGMASRLCDGCEVYWLRGRCRYDWHRMHVVWNSKVCVTVGVDGSGLRTLGRCC